MCLLQSLLFALAAPFIRNSERSKTHTESLMCLRISVVRSGDSISSGRYCSNVPLFKTAAKLKRAKFRIYYSALLIFTMIGIHIQNSGMRTTWRENQPQALLRHRQKSGISSAVRARVCACTYSFIVHAWTSIRIRIKSSSSTFDSWMVCVDDDFSYIRSIEPHLRATIARNVVLYALNWTNLIKLNAVLSI